MEFNLKTTKLQLPLELVLEILEYVDDEDLVHLLAICKSCHRALKERLYHTIPPLYQSKKEFYDVVQVLEKIS